MHAIGLCVNVNKEKVKKAPSVKKKKKKNSDTEDAMIEMSEERTIFSSIASSTSSGNKRKKLSTFSSPERKLEIYIFAPIKTACS